MFKCYRSCIYTFQNTLVFVLLKHIRWCENMRIAHKSYNRADRCEGRFVYIRMISLIDRRPPQCPGARSHALLLMVISKKVVITYVGRLCTRSSTLSLLRIEQPTYPATWHPFSTELKLMRWAREWREVLAVYHTSCLAYLGFSKDKDSVKSPRVNLPNRTTLFTFV